jgi:DNA-binding transcriptional ArsR family regulator
MESEIVPVETNLERIPTNREIVSVEPAVNAFTSMILVCHNDDSPGLHEWVTRTQAQMSADEQFRHQLVINGLYYSVIRQLHAPSFEVYMKQLDTTPPEQFRHSLLHAYDQIYEEYKEDLSGVGKPDWDNALSSPSKYVSQLVAIFGEDKTNIGVETRVYDYVMNPPELKKLVTSHIYWFWETFLRDEWKRVESMIQETTRAFNKLDLKDLSRRELFGLITGKEFHESKSMGYLESAKELVFIPNPHIGPYMRTIIIRGTANIVFGARLPEGSGVHIPELDRTEIVSKMAALADETRLSILRLLAERGEMRSSEIMDEIKLGQPSVSRYLAQLTANGFINEKRMNSAKVYSINPEKFDKIFQAITNYLFSHAR